MPTENRKKYAFSTHKYTLVWIVQFRMHSLNFKLNINFFLAGLDHARLGAINVARMNEEWMKLFGMEDENEPLTMVQ